MATPDTGTSEKPATTEGDSQPIGDDKKEEKRSLGDYVVGQHPGNERGD
jgi:hypothetical protein